MPLITARPRVYLDIEIEIAFGTKIVLYTS